jgi:hypothetical protein
MADEEQCKGCTHPIGALPTSIAELGRKAGVAAMISEVAESRWKEIKSDVKKRSSTVEVSGELFSKAKMQENRAAGEVLLDGGQGEQRLESGDGERARAEELVEQSMSSKSSSSITKSEHSKQYTAARQDRNRRRRKEKKKKIAKQKRQKEPAVSVACLSEPEKNVMNDDVLFEESDQSDCETVLPELKAREESDESDSEMLEKKRETAVPALLMRYESSDSEGEEDIARPISKQQSQSSSESEDSDSERDDEMPRLSRRRYRDDSNAADSSDEEEHRPPRRRPRKKKRSTRWPGLNPPRVNGENKRQLRRENKAKRIQKQESQEETSYWSTHNGQFRLPEQKEGQTEWLGEMCLRNLALHHPAAEKLLQYATGGCPANMGLPWSKEEMQAAIDRGPHVSALVPEAIKQLQLEVNDKVRKGQAKVVLWDDIKDDPPKELKISPIAMIPHKSRMF